MRLFNPLPPRAWPPLLLAAALGCVQPAAPTAPPDQVTVRGAGSRAAGEGSGVVLPNAGRLQGTVYGPAPGLIARELGEASRLPLEGAFSLRTRREGEADPGTVALPGVQLTALDVSGQAVSSTVITDARGAFTIDALRASGPLLYLRATFSREGCPSTLLALAPAPRPVGYVVVNLSPASTVVTRKALAQLQGRLLNPLLLPTALTERTSATFAGVMSDRALTVAACAREPQAGKLFDTLFAGLPQNVRSALLHAGEQLDSTALFEPVLPNSAPESLGTAPPTEPPEPFARTPEASPTVGVAPISSAQPSASGTLSPTPTGSPLRAVLRTLAKAASGLRVELPPEGLDPDLFAPSETGAEGARLESAEASVTLRDLERSITAVCFDGDTRYELSGDQLIWDDFVITIAGSGASTYGDVAVHEGHAYLTGIEPHNIVRVKLDTAEVEVFAGQTIQNEGGMRDGGPGEAEFNEPRGLVAAPDALYVADAGNHRVRRVTYEGMVTTFAGGETPGTTDGTGAFARFVRPLDITRDPAGNLYVADAEAHNIRRISRSALVRTLTSSLRGSTDGAGAAGRLDSPSSVTWGRVGGSEVLVVGQADGLLRLLTGW